MRLAIRSYSRRKKRNAKPSVLVSAARWVLAFFCLLYLAWAIFLPSSSGFVGRLIESHVWKYLGYSSYVLPLLLAYVLALYFKAQKTSGYWMGSLGTLLCLTGATTLLSAVGSLSNAPQWGGDAGVVLHSF